MSEKKYVACMALAVICGMILVAAATLLGQLIAAMSLLGGIEMLSNRNCWNWKDLMDPG